MDFLLKANVTFVVLVIPDHEILTSPVLLTRTSIRTEDTACRILIRVRPGLAMWKDIIISMTRSGMQLTSVLARQLTVHVYL